MKTFKGSFTIVIEADTQEELDSQMDILHQSLQELQEELKDVVDIGGFGDTETEWVSD